MLRISRFENSDRVEPTGQRVDHARAAYGEPYLQRHKLREMMSRRTLMVAFSRLLPSAMWAVATPASSTTFTFLTQSPVSEARADPAVNHAHRSPGALSRSGIYKSCNSSQNCSLPPRVFPDAIDGRTQLSVRLCLGLHRRSERRYLPFGNTVATRPRGAIPDWGKQWVN